MCIVKSHCIAFAFAAATGHTFQAGFTCLTGYGLGIGLCTLLIALAKLRMPDYAAMITYGNLAVAFVMVVIIAGVSSYVGVRQVLRIEPFDIFRG